MNSSLQRPVWQEAMAQEAWRIAQLRIEASQSTQRFEQYQNDPVGFGEQVLNERYTDDIKSVMLSVRDNPVTIARSSNGVGKSHGAARIAIWYYKVFPDSKVFVTAAPPLENLKRILWGEIASLTIRHPELFASDKVKTLSVTEQTEANIDDPRHFVTGVTIPTSGTVEEREAKFSGKHAPHMLFIIDEGDAVPDEVYKGIESCVSGGDARILIMFNPRAQAGPVWIKERDRQAKVVKLSALDHPNVRTGKNIIPGAVTREVTVRRINEWTRPLAHGEPIDSSTFEVPDFLVGETAKALDGRTYDPLIKEYRKITQAAFAYMVLGEYPAQSEQALISRNWIDAARARWDSYVAKFGEVPPAATSPIMGVDLAEFGRDANVVCLRYGGYIAPLINWNGVDADQSALRALEEYRLHNVNIAMIDGTGVGASVAPAMSRMGRNEDVRAISVKIASKPSRFIKTELGEFKILRDQLWWAAREWLRTDPGAMLPPDEKLIEELLVATYEPRNGKIEVMKKERMRDLLKRSPDRADAFCLTFNPVARPTVAYLVE